MKNKAKKILIVMMFLPVMCTGSRRYMPLRMAQSLSCLWQISLNGDIR